MTSSVKVTNKLLSALFYLQSLAITFDRINVIVERVFNKIYDVVS